MARPTLAHRRSPAVNGGPIPPTRSISMETQGQARSACSARRRRTRFDNATQRSKPERRGLSCACAARRLPRINPLIWTNFSGMLGVLRLSSTIPAAGVSCGTFWRNRRCLRRRRRSGAVVRSIISPGTPIAPGARFAMTARSRPSRPKVVPSRSTLSSLPPASRPISRRDPSSHRSS